MNKDILKGNWKRFKGEVKEEWGELTDDDMAKIEGNYDQLVGAVQARYGYERADAEREVDDYLEKVESDIA